eukprot:TRINITY_DN62016_c0_g1_i1.p1 TRINITY_DN62016_c0_g1~~TRINITY_DN62016_c0_g1_i1.p1  ORF type:complete len:299 (+),score=55.49 TRINITY_DN62016_c0_g1_i1:78-974(+)
MPTEARGSAALPSPIPVGDSPDGDWVVQLPAAQPGAVPLAAAARSEQRLRECARALLGRGCCALDGALGPEETAALRRQLDARRAAGGMRHGVVGGTGPLPRQGAGVVPTRSDEVCFVTSAEWPELAQYTAALDPFVASLLATAAAEVGAGAPVASREVGAAARGEGISTRVRPMCAHYPAGSCGYARHRDNPGGATGNGRVLTAILYLNNDWGEGDGGCLRLWLGAGSVSVQHEGTEPTEPRLVAPRGGRLLLFWSWMQHEVLPTQAGRSAVTVWYSDKAKIVEARQLKGLVSAFLP